MNPAPASAPEITCPLRAAARRDPSALAIVDAAGCVTYGELDAWVDAIVARLAGAGIGQGQTLALHLPNERATVALLLAVIRHGAIACPLNGRNPAEVINSQLIAGECVGIVFLGTGENGDVPSWSKVPAHPVASLVVFSAADLVAGGAVRRMDATQPATLIFTSGSTAMPKAALHRLGNHLAAAAASNRHHGLRAEDQWLLSLPLYHVGGLAIVFRCLLAGASIAIPATGEPLGEALARYRPSHVSLVPTQLRRLLQDGAGRPPPDGLRGVLLGGAAAPVDLLADARASGWPVRQTYGLTEMASQVTAVTHDTHEMDATAGRPLPGCEIHLSPEGEILVRGPGLFLGYRDGGTCMRAVDAEGWFATGDLGRLDASGNLTVIGRRDNLFISGGENIQPEEVEAALASLPGVAQAVVVPIPDAEFGARPVAYLEWIPGHPVVPAAELARQLASRLPRYKIPVAFYVLPASFMATSLKARRRDLAAHAAAMLSGNRGPGA